METSQERQARINKMPSATARTLATTIGYQSFDLLDHLAQPGEWIEVHDRTLSLEMSLSDWSMVFLALQLMTAHELRENACGPALYAATIGSHIASAMAEALQPLSVA